MGKKEYQVIAQIEIRYFEFRDGYQLRITRDLGPQGAAIHYVEISEEIADDMATFLRFEITR